MESSAELESNAAAEAEAEAEDELNMASIYTDTDEAIIQTPFKVKELLAPLSARKDVKDLYDIHARDRLDNHNSENPISGTPPSGESENIEAIGDQANFEFNNPLLKTRSEGTTGSLYDLYSGENLETEFTSPLLRRNNTDRRNPSIEKPPKDDENKGEFVDFEEDDYYLKEVVVKAGSGLDSTVVVKVRDGTENTPIIDANEKANKPDPSPQQDSDFLSSLWKGSLSNYQFRQTSKSGGSDSEEEFPATPLFCAFDTSSDSSSYCAIS